MRNKFIQQLAQEINKENHRLKQHSAKLQNKLSDYENKIMECMQLSGISICTNDDLLVNFKSILKQIKIDQQGKKQQSQHIESLQREIKSLQRNVSNKCQLISRIQAQRQQLKQRYTQQRQKLIINNASLQQQLQKYNNQIQQIRQQFEKQQKKKEIQSIDLAAQHRQHLHELVISHKQEMMNFRKDIEQQTWKMQAMLRKEIQSKNQQIKKLILNIDKLQKNGSISQSDWKILQNFFLPYRNHTDNTEKISKLRQQISNLKLEVRKLTQNLTESEIARAQFQNQAQNLRLSFNRMKASTQQNNQLIANLRQQAQQIAQKNKKLTAYYDEKWIQQFDKVRKNLEKKMTNKMDNLQSQYINKTKEVQQKINSYLSENIKLKEKNKLYQQQTTKANNLTAQALKMYENQKSLKESLAIQLENVKKQYEVILQKKLNIERELYSQQIDELQKKIDDIMYENKCNTQKLQRNIQQLQQQAKQIKIQNQQKIIEIEQQYNKKIQNYEEMLNDKQKLINQFEKEEQKLLWRAEKKYEQARSLQVKKIKDQCDLKMEDLEKKCQLQIRKVKDNIKELEYQLKEVKMEKQQLKLEHIAKDRIYTELIAQKDAHIQELQGKTNNIYLIKHQLDEQKRKNKAIKTQTQLQKQSMFSMIQSKQAQLYELSTQLRDVVVSKNKWQRQLKKIKTDFLVAFKETKDQSNKIINFYKSRIRQLELIIERKPMNSKDFQKIQILTEENRKLQDRVSMKQAENLILMQIKDYYQSRTQQQKEPKQSVNDHKKIFVRKMKHKQNSILLSLKHTQSQQKVSVQSNQQLSQMKQYIDRQMRKGKSTRTRINSSMT